MNLRIVVMRLPLILSLIVCDLAGASDSSDVDPIAFVGHGAMFGADGREINVTPEFIERAQEYYLRRLSSDSPEQSAESSLKRRNALDSAGLEGQDLLIARSQLIAALAAESRQADASLIAAKNALIRQLLRTRVSAINQPIGTGKREHFELSAQTIIRLKSQGLEPDNVPLETLGDERLAYINACKEAGVPIPPDWGDARWVSKGVLTNPFISTSLVAEVFGYESSAPEGACIALPRSFGNSIELLGVICLGKATSKACFWDNQQGDKQFSIPVGSATPLLDFAGGPELDRGSGGVCSDCHAGENPFNIHPKTALGLPALRGMKLRADNWYSPMVAVNWPQNAGPSDVLDTVPSPGMCTDCHYEQGSGGRFPILSAETPGYCSAVLRRAVEQTMPVGGVGDTDYIAHIDALLATCPPLP